MTSINKAKVQNTTSISIRKNNCILKCYQQNIYRTEDEIITHDTVEEIRDCKKRCGQQLKSVKKYLNDINYYSGLKFTACSKKCPGDESKVEHNECIWECLNRLDRRYKKYWQELKEQV